MGKLSDTLQKLTHASNNNNNNKRVAVTQIAQQSKARIISLEYCSHLLPIPQCGSYDYFYISISYTRFSLKKKCGVTFLTPPVLITLALWLKVTHPNALIQNNRKVRFHSRHLKTCA